MRVLVIGGGISDEREVSLRSAASVNDALEKSGHNSFFYDWDGSSEWLGKNAVKFDVVFPVLHGKGGEDGQIQKILEDLNVKFVGTDSAHSANCMDKHLTRDLLAKQGIRVPSGGTIVYEEYLTSKLFNRPHVLKSILGGSSIDTFIFPTKESLVNRQIGKVERAFSRLKTMLIEEYISGTEITVPILEGFKLDVIEIIPPKDEIFNYENKYNGRTQELCPPVSVNLKFQNEAIQLAERCHQIMGCRHLSRTDIIIHGNEIYVLEINTMPGFTSQSLYPRSAQVAGLSMSELTDYLVNLAKE